MLLKDITKCPDCGCTESKSETKSYRGFSQDYLRFPCGCTYVSSRDSFYKLGVCTRTEEYKTKCAKRERAWDQIKTFLKELDVDQEWKDAMSRHW